MVDLHCHILPGIDDGPETYEESVKLIKLEIDNGVDTVALTPHFYIDQCSPSDFLQRREKLTANLKNAISDCSIEMKLLQAAEVRLSPKLIDIPFVKNFCYEGTVYMLVELPMEYYYDWIPKTLYELRMGGIIPILAHVERYSYFLKKTQLLADLVNAGSMVQVNAGSLVAGSRHQQQFVCKLIRLSLVQVVATDAHSVKHRPPRLKQAMQIIERKFGSDMVQYFDSNSKNITAAGKPILLGR